MMEIVKNKEEVKSVMNIIQAFANGKTIQAIDPYEDEWVDQAGLNFKALLRGNTESSQNIPIANLRTQKSAGRKCKNISRLDIRMIGLMV